MSKGAGGEEGGSHRGGTELCVCLCMLCVWMCLDVHPSVKEIILTKLGYIVARCGPEPTHSPSVDKCLSQWLLHTCYKKKGRPAYVLMWAVSCFVVDLISWTNMQSGIFFSHREPDQFVSCVCSSTYIWPLFNSKRFPLNQLWPGQAQQFIWYGAVFIYWLTEKHPKDTFQNKQEGCCWCIPSFLDRFSKNMFCLFVRWMVVEWDNGWRNYCDKNMALANSHTEQCWRDIHCEIRQARPILVWVVVWAMSSLYRFCIENTLTGHLFKSSLIQIIN